MISQPGARTSAPVSKQPTPSSSSGFYAHPTSYRKACNGSPSKSGSAGPAGSSDSESDPVLAFLRSLKPDQSRLLPVFLSQGVTGGPELNGLAQMDARDSWLYCWVKERRITEFQYSLILAGLRALPRAELQSFAD